ncbi:Threonylcarbamoyl-AMP synthase [subsurface metagenome]
MIIDYCCGDIGRLGVENLAIRPLVVYFMAPMHTKVVKLDATNVDSAKIKEAASLVDDGGLVAFPTETVYGIACRVKTDSLARLNNIKGRDRTKYYTLHIGQKNDVKKYVPTIGLRAEKLIRNAWPGPLTIVFELDHTDIDKQKKILEREFFKNLYKNNSIGIRCPDNLIATMLLQAAHNPVIAPSANIAGQPPAVDAEQVLAQLSGQIEMLLDAGPCKHKKSSSIVKIGKIGLEILRPGVYSQAQLDAMSAVKFLFVCTGNTCRSPMAEGIFRKYLAEKLQCKVDQLNKIGYKVRSAGVIDTAGVPASAEAITACAARGINLIAHRNKGLSKELIEESDFIFAMERMHQEKIIALSPEAASKCSLLAGDKGIADPIGHPQEFFNSCADMIEAAVKKKISELVI